MNFNRYQSTYEVFHRGVNGKPPWRQFYRDTHRVMSEEIARNRTAAMVLSYNHMIAEEEWYEHGKPYYKVWPAMVDGFIGTRLDISADLLRAPHPAFVICLPTDPMLDFTFNGQSYAVKSIMVLSQNEAQQLAGYTVERIEQRNLHIWIDIGEEYQGTPLFTWRHGIFPPDSTIEDGFANLPIAHETMQGVLMPIELTEACIRLAVAVCFLACGGERVIERDVLSRHLDEYRREGTSPDRKMQIEATALRNGLGGWHIGRGRSERELRLRKGLSYEDAIREAGGRQLLYQHIRGGHFRRVRYGPKLASERVQYIDSVMVRPDLPPKPIDR